MESNNTVRLIVDACDTNGHNLKQTEIISINEERTYSRPYGGQSNLVPTKATESRKLRKVLRVP
jgi:hypothetical protein